VDVVIHAVKADYLTGQVKSYDLLIASFCCGRQFETTGPDSINTGEVIARSEKHIPLVQRLCPVNDAVQLVQFRFFKTAGQT
jgi:hypothetical protein